MNNRGFAITTIIFGTMVLFCLLLVSLLSILSVYKTNMEKLIDSDNGTRKIITMKANKSYASIDALRADSNNPGRGLYCFTSNGECKYVSNSDLGR